MTPSFYTSSVPDQAAKTLESALGALSQALHAHRALRNAEKRQSKAPFKFPAPIRIGEVMSRPAPTDADLFLGLMRVEPVDGAFKFVMREIGRHLYEIGGHDLMESVLDRVANQPLDCFPGHSEGSDFDRQCSVINSAWDGIGDSWFA